MYNDASVQCLNLSSLSHSTANKKNLKYAESAWLATQICNTGFDRHVKVATSVMKAYSVEKIMHLFTS